MPTAQRITRTYNVRTEIYQWLEARAAENLRAVMRQVEAILEDAYAVDMAARGQELKQPTKKN